MDMYPKYKSKFGYQIGNNQIDNYGFGTTDIAANIEKMQNNPTPIPVATPTPQATNIK